MQTAVPEAMTEIDINDVRFSCATDTDDYQAVGIGPGLGRAEDTEAALLDQIDSCQTPMIVDADALNLLGEHRSYIGRLPKGSILTPHPKELERLVGKCQNSYERLTKARELAKSAGVYIILKGAYSVIIAPSGKCWFNPTGNPGMATGGSGDVLTGVVLALLAQGYDAETAARMAAYVHGLAEILLARAWSNGYDGRGYCYLLTVGMADAGGEIVNCMLMLVFQYSDVLKLIDSFFTFL